MVKSNRVQRHARRDFFTHGKAILDTILASNDGRTAA
jgi:hypothetical protein